MAPETEHVLLPTDFSPPSHVALKHALRFATLLGAPLTVVHVVDSRSVDVVPGQPPGLVMGQTDELEKIAAERLEREVASAADSGVTIRSVVRYGVPGQEILELAKEAGATLIVMGTHGRTGVVRALLGSQAEWILRRSDIPVLTVHEGTAD